MTLWHYTCQHGHEAIQRTQPVMLKPHPTIGWLWLTDLDAPNRDALGLTSHTLHCDRTQHRYRVDDPYEVYEWMSVRREFEPNVRSMLESTPGVMPRHWWIAFQPVPASYDPVEPYRPTASLAFLNRVRL